LIITPNPFRQKTKINLRIGQRAKFTELKIYDATGRLVKDFSRLTLDALRFTFLYWDGTDDKGERLPQGVYFVRLENEYEALTKKVVLIK
jgi:flagellar hook assembly protein FlgD